MPPPSRTRQQPACRHHQADPRHERCTNAPGRSFRGHRALQCRSARPGRPATGPHISLLGVAMRRGRCDESARATRETLCVRRIGSDGRGCVGRGTATGRVGIGQSVATVALCRYDLYSVYLTFGVVAPRATRPATLSRVQKSVCITDSPFFAQCAQVTTHITFALTVTRLLISFILVYNLLARRTDLI